MKLDYSNSGIKTLRIASAGLMLCGIASAILLVPFWLINTSMIAASFTCLFFGIFLCGVGLSIATIAESSLYQKQKMEEQETDD